MVIKKKQHFYSLTKTEVHVPPRFTMQVWDNDLFSPDDFIGELNAQVSIVHVYVYTCIGISERIS